MSLTSTLVPLFAIVGAVGLAVAFIKAKAPAKNDNAIGQDAAFKAKTLLTANELEFLARLEFAAPELRFCPQVAMGALLEPAVPRKDAKAYYRSRGMFAQKIVDFVAQRRDTGAVVAVIELDDRTHSVEKDEKRDAMLAQAGYKIIRWHSKNKPSVAEIRATLVPQATTYAAPSQPSDASQETRAQAVPSRPISNSGPNSKPATRLLSTREGPEATTR